MKFLTLLALLFSFSALADENKEKKKKEPPKEVTPHNCTACHKKVPDPTKDNNKPETKKIDIKPALTPFEELFK